MKKQIITGLLCGGVGLFIGYKLTVNQVTKSLKSDELKEEILFETRTVSMQVLDNLNELITTYGMASVADLYELSGLTSKFTDNKYGWTDIGSAKVYKTKDGYSIKMPEATKLK